MFSCNKCCSKFYQKKYLTKHEKRMHPIASNGTNNNELSFLFLEDKCTIVCKEDGCGEKFRKISELRNHLENIHLLNDINTCQNLQFSNKTEFLKWLHEEEKNTNSKYVIGCSEKKLNDYSYTSYICNRSGTFHSKAKLQQKQLKAQGSRKTGHYCTSNIIAKDFESHLEISYYAQHYKHEKELQHIPIPEEDKLMIAGKLLEGVEDRHIIQNLWNISDQDNISRRNIITKKDLYNIKKQFGINIKSRGSALEEDQEALNENEREISSSENTAKYKIENIHTCNDYCSNNICTNGKQNFARPLNKNSKELNLKKTAKQSSLNFHERNKQKFLTLYSKINSIQNMDDDRAKQIQYHLNAIDHLLNIPISYEPKLINKTNEPDNKKIQKQKRLFSNKKLKIIKKPKLSKPSVTEWEIKKSILLNPELISCDINNDHSYYC